MRVDNHIHLRHIMLYHFEKGWTVISWSQPSFRRGNNCR